MKLQDERHTLHRICISNDLAVEKVFNGISVMRWKKKEDRSGGIRLSKWIARQANRGPFLIRFSRTTHPVTIVPDARQRFGFSFFYFSVRANTPSTYVPWHADIFADDAEFLKTPQTVCHPSTARLHAARIYYDTPHCQEKQLLLFAQSSSYDKLSSSSQERRSTFSSISSNVIFVFHQKLSKLTVN